MNRRADAHEPERMATGIAGLDHILRGGLLPRRLYLIEGMPGTGKTTLGLQFLLEGARRGEPGLFVTLSESKDELRASAAAHGWSLDGLSLFELIDIEGAAGPDSEYVMFHPAEVELSSITKSVLAEVERINPLRVVFDSLSELRLLAQDPLRYRRQILAMKQFFVERGCTVLMLDENRSERPDLGLRSLVHGVLSLEIRTPLYGGERRRLQVVKMRGMEYRGGYHDFRILQGGLEIYPRLTALEHPGEFAREEIASGLAQLDAMLGGGLERGSSALVMGPAGSGKSSVATRIALQTAAQSKPAAIFVFDETRETYLVRSAGLGMDLTDYLADGRITLQQIDPAELSPGQFTEIVRRAVEETGVRVIVLDSLNGYATSMMEERFLILHMHEMLGYLSQQGVMTLLILELEGTGGVALQETLNASYLADAVILLRYFEGDGELRKAITVVKKRTSRHERTVHELLFDSSGLSVGEPMREFRGILHGLPIWDEPTRG
jgi:circadian clock protein KaiC